MAYPSTVSLPKHHVFLVSSMHVTCPIT